MLKKLHILLSLILLGLSVTNFAFSQSYCTVSTSVCDEYISNVSLGDINNSSGCTSGGYANYTDKSTALIKGKDYTIKVTIGNPWSSDQCRLWIDYNHDGTFDNSSEYFTLTSSDGATTFSATINVPATALSGTTRMRIGLIYASTPPPCNNSTYGEYEDYTVDLRDPTPDAAFTSLTSPVVPFSVGVYPVKAVLASKNNIVLQNCTITWAVNGEVQGILNWTGNLKKDQTEEIYLGNYSFTYPEGSSYNPFKITIQVSNVNGFPFDSDPTNDLFSKSIAPTLNDCGAIGFFGPAEGFGPGVTQVRARVKNYAPKPLSSVTINWKVDGVAQTPVTLSGLYIKEGQYQDLVVGTYTFYNKTPLGPFDVEVVTSNPNGVTDEDQTNDKYVGGIGPSLVSGVYYVGGMNAHFNDLATAMSYLNSGGVFGTGTVTFEIRPGTYYGPIVLNNPPLNNNHIELRSSSGNPYDVIITANPTNKNNYVFMVDGYHNITFKNLSLQNTNSNNSLAGTVLRANNANIALDKVVLNGVRNAPNDFAYNNVYITSSGFTSSKSVFLGGSNALYCDNSYTSDIINVENTTFTDFTISGINYSGSLAANIKNNSFKWETGNVPNNAITIYGSANIESNSFSGIRGTGSTSDAVIIINGAAGTIKNNIDNQKNKNNTPNILSDYTTNIVGNNISGTNINGIRLDYTNAVINRNYVNLTQTTLYQNGIVYSNASSGWIGNNMLLGNNIYGIYLNNSNDMNIIYNTISLVGNGSALRFNGSSCVAARNIIINNGTSYNFEINGSANTFQNLNYNQAVRMGLVNGQLKPTLASLQDAGFEKNSKEALVTTETESNLHIKYYIPELLFGGPLFSDNSYGSLIEGSDYDGNARTSFNAGADEIFLKIVINRQSDGFVDCENSNTNELTVSAEINYGASVTYQWYKDGLPIEGATNPVLYFPLLKFSQSGVYKCLVEGPGTTAPVMSKPVAVYVSTPTAITKQPSSKTLTLGDLATLRFDAHVNGKSIEDAIAYSEVKVQWYKIVNGNNVAVVDNQKNAGAKSNYLTIKKVAKSDLGLYFAVIEGLCGIDTTNTVELTEEVLDITITESPTSVTQCQNTDITFNANATTKSSKSIEYQWYKDGVKLSNISGKIDGTNSKHLTVYKMSSADAGSYWAIANLQGTGVQATTSKATLTVKSAPVITVQPDDVNINADQQLVLIAEVENMDEPGLTFQWYKDGSKIDDATESTYMVEKAQVENSGNYYCDITNNCGTTRTNNVVVTVTSTGATDVSEVVKGGYSISTAVPNPVSTISNFRYNLANSGNVLVTLSDARGQIVSEIINQYQSNGEYTAQINSHNLVNGIYFIKLEVNGYVLVNKVVVNK